jgi:hypothetical protein
VRRIEYPHRLFYSLLLISKGTVRWERSPLIEVAVIVTLYGPGGAISLPRSVKTSVEIVRVSSCDRALVKSTTEEANVQRAVAGSVAQARYTRPEPPRERKLMVLATAEPAFT